MSVQEQQPQSARIEIEGSEGVALKQLTAEDAQRYFDLVDADREHLSQFDDNTASKYQDVESVRDSIENPGKPDKLRFGIWGGDEMVGTINLTSGHSKTAEVGYWVGRQHTGHGYARKATKLLANYAFDELDLELLTAWVSPKNEPSIKTLEKAGFKRTTNGKNLHYELNRRNI